MTRRTEIKTGLSEGVYIRVAEDGTSYRRRVDWSTVDPPATVFASTHQIDSNASGEYLGLSSEEMLWDINVRIGHRTHALVVMVVASLVACVGVGATLSYGTWEPDPILGNWPVILSCILFLGSLLVLGVGMVVAEMMRRQGNLERTTILRYTLSPVISQSYAMLQEALGELASCERVWVAASETLVTDWKRNAGATSVVQRSVARVMRTMPPFLKVDIETYGLTSIGIGLFFLPDQILVLKNGQYAAIDYAGLEARASETRFIEEEQVPADSRVVSYTWRYVRKDGGPDLRFSNNRRIPILVYGVLELRTGADLVLSLHLSKSAVASRVAHALSASSRSGTSRASFSESASSRSGGKRTSPPGQRSQADSPYAVLGISPGASQEEIAAAYRRMAKMYHPDRVAGLGPELQELADKQMKAINAAYDQLRESRI